MGKCVAGFELWVSMFLWWNFRFSINEIPGINMFKYYETYLPHLPVVAMTLLFLYPKQYFLFIVRTQSFTPKYFVTHLTTPPPHMRLIQIYPQRKYLECVMGNAQFQVRKCPGDNNLWSVLLKTQNKWINIVIIKSTIPPLKWLSLFYYSSGLHTPSDYRKQVIQSNKHRP